MRILFISLNRERLPYAVLPIGVAYLAGTVREAGHHVRILDLCTVDDPRHTLEETIADFEPDVIGLSLRNVDNVKCLPLLNEFYLPRYRSLVAHVKACSAAQLIIGGAGFSLLPIPILRYYDLTFGVVGEGELTFPEFLWRVERGQDCHSLPGVAWRCDGNSGVNAPQRVPHLDALPRPAWDLVNFGAYNAPDEPLAGSIQSKRGCAFACNYCVYPLLEGRRCRLRAPEKVVDEIEYLQREFNVQHFHFVDSVFNFPQSHARAICSEIIQRRLDVRWNASFSPRPADFSKELLVLARDSGCTILALGIDTASDQVLEGLHKSFKKEAIFRAADLCRQVGLAFTCYLMLGGVGEDIHTLRETLDAMEQVQPDALLANTGIRLYPKTMLSLVAEQEGVVEPGCDYLEPVFYVSPQLHGDWNSLLRQYAERNTTWTIHYPT